MSLLQVLLVVVAFIIAAGLVALADKFLGPKLGYPRWIIQVAYGLLLLIVVIYLCRAFRVFELLSSVRA